MVVGHMTENQNNTPKVEENSSAPNPSGVGDDLISLEEMEAFIAQNDPEFAKQMESFAPEGGGPDLNIDLVDLDQLMAEDAASSMGSKWRQFAKVSRSRIIIFTAILQSNLILFLEEGLPELLKKTKNGFSHFLQSISDGLRRFSFWPAKKKWATFGLIFGALGTGIFIFLVATKPMILAGNDLFILSLESHADSVHTYDPLKESEPFYDSARASQNIMSLQKIVVNIKRSSQSGPNPMGAFEFFIEGNSPDVMVEIKDREYEVKDLFQRNAEEMTFDQMESADGKQLLLEKLRREVNRNLTKGRVRKVLFKTVILKP